MTAQQGEKLEHENNFKDALAKFRFAGSLLEQLTQGSRRLAAGHRGLSQPQNRREHFARGSQGLDPKRFRDNLPARSRADTPWRSATGGSGW